MYYFLPFENVNETLLNLKCLDNLAFLSLKPSVFLA